MQALAAELIDACLDGGFDPTFSDELLFDHATFLPLHFLNPNMARARRADHHQHADPADADGEALLCLRPIPWQCSRQQIQSASP